MPWYESIWFFGLLYCAGVIFFLKVLGLLLSDVDKLLKKVGEKAGQVAASLLVTMDERRHIRRLHERAVKNHLEAVIREQEGGTHTPDRE